jgi:cytochrome c553
MSTLNRSVLFVSLGALTLSGCQRDETVAEHMEGHFTQVSAIQEAVIRGDLDAVKEPAEWLARHRPVDSLPEGWEPHVADMSRAAQQALDATTLEGAASATAAMGQACGACHQSAATGPSFSIGQEINTDRGVGAHMQRHQWGADRMWEGLIGPSDTSWAWGAATLREAPLRPQGQPERIAELAALVHELGARADEATDLAARSTIYGEMLATCGQCHTALSRGPDAPGPEG